MKEINGTITLAYLEEDNKQRVIFRVIPLCTREGGAFRGDAESFPDEGSLRIVPDKREQSTFKERMRELGSLCAIYLISDGKELMKVRANRNYSPEQGERNQYAIYSDVICEFTSDGCFEVVEAGASAEGALTEKVLIYKDKLLYGPVNRAGVADASLAALKPFGNDHFLLHTIESPIIGTRRVYWNPDATVNWRQRRNIVRRRDRGAELPLGDMEAARDMPPAPIAAAGDAAAPAKPVTAPADLQSPAETAPEAPKPLNGEAQKQPSAANEAPRQNGVKQSEGEAQRRISVNPIAIKHATPKPDEAAAAARPHEQAQEPRSRITEHGAREHESEAALPIGSRLNILDEQMPFDAQIDRLAQPLSESANRLTDLPEEPVEDDGDEVVARFTGTPLVPPAIRVKRTAARPDTMHGIVEQQLRGQRDEVMGAEIGSGVYGMVENPIETLRNCIDYIWQNPEARSQAIAALMESESFTSDMLAAMRREGMNPTAAAAAQEMLSEIEAERLSLLMQLETAKANESKFREEAIKALSQKRRDESERLKREIDELERVKAALNKETQALSSKNVALLTEYMANNMTCLTGVGEQRILLSPVLGSDYTPAELAEQLRRHMNDSGYSLSEDDAMSLLISFSLFDTLCLRDDAIEDASHFARVFLESFGLQSVSAIVMPGAYVEMVSLLPENLKRAPTVTVQPLGTETMEVYGHKTIFLADANTQVAEGELVCGYPTISAPKLQRRASDYAEEWRTIAPASLASFAAVRSEARPLMDEAEKWLSMLSGALRTNGLEVPELVFGSMRRFIEVASRKVHSGFLGAADSAVAYWLAPVMLLRKAQAGGLMDVLAGLPHTLELLNV